ncbi:MAG: cobalt-precorrin 5A hydrolase [Clostridia bacterium]|nr:cobalt-precorrin 5A hydrolase [Clostridia bacterium]
MKWAIISATKGGLKQAAKISKMIDVDIYGFEKAVGEEHVHDVHVIDGSLKDLVGRIFNQYDTLIFIMAAGIVIRVISSYIKDKTQDPAVLVMDEEGKYIISLLSGHLGGANERAVKLAEYINACPVITTASDAKGIQSIDMLAKEMNYIIDDMEKAKEITALMVNDFSVGMIIDKDLEDSLDVKKVNGIKKWDPKEDEKIDGLVYISNRTTHFNIPMVQLIPKTMVLGIGCKKHYDSHTLLEQLKHIMQKNNIHIKSIKKVATIPLKRHEQAVKSAAEMLDAELEIVPIEKIEAIEDNFESSPFVKKIVGIGSVAEPCGYLVSNKGICVVPKTIVNGMTVSIWEEKNG